MNAPMIKGYLYLAIAALLLLIALPTILNIILIGIAIAFILSGLSTLKENIRL